MLPQITVCYISIRHKFRSDRMSGGYISILARPHVKGGEKEEMCGKTRKSVQNRQQWRDCRKLHGKWSLNKISQGVPLYVVAVDYTKRRQDGLCLSIHPQKSVMKRK